MSKERNVNIDLLKIISMLSILALHYLSQSDVRNIINISSWQYTVMQSYGRIACTVFFIISSWYLSEMDFSIKRVLKVEMAAAFWGILAYVMARMCDWQLDEYNFRDAFFPSIRQPLWFIGVYVEILCLSPILNVAIRELEIAVYRYAVLLPLAIVIIYSTIFVDDGRIIREPVFFPMVYMFVGYIKRFYGEKVKRYRKFYLLGSIICYAFICALQLSKSIVTTEVGNMLADTGSYYRSRFWTLPNFLCAISSFLLFYSIPSIKRGKRWIGILASPTLGIYCIHQNPIFVNKLWSVCDSIVENSGIKHVFIVPAIIVCLYIFLGAIENARVDIIERPLMKLCHGIHNGLENTLQDV